MYYNKEYEMEINKLTKEYAIVDGEQIWFDEPFDELPSKKEFEKWLKTIKKVLEKTLASKNK
jgi:HEPN domain-containing protein